MRNIWLVIKHDTGVTLKQRSFWVLTLLMPTMMLAVNAYAVIKDNDLGSAVSSSSSEQEGTAEAPTGLPSIGLVDEAELIQEIPADIPSDLFVRFPDQTAAQAALRFGEIDQYVLIPAGYVTSGQVIVYDHNFQIFLSGQDMGVAFNSTNEWALTYLINYNLSGGDENLVTALRNPTPGRLAERHVLNPPVKTNESDQALVEVVYRLMPFVYYFLLIMGSSYLMRSVIAEKENRLAEVLMLSLPPRQLMVGKILAMSFVVLIQLAFWVGGGLLVLNKSAQALSVSSFSFPPGFIIWALLYLVLGYLLFAAVMAATGALASNSREVSQVTFVLIIPLMPTLMFGDLFAQEPNHPLTLVMSLFPFSAPSAMVTRLAIGEVPRWQLLISLGGLALTTYLFIVLAGRFFRAGNLLSTTPFNWRRLATGWRK